MDFFIDLLLALRDIAASIRELRPVPNPTSIRIVTFMEVGSMLFFKVLLPDPPAGIAGGKLTLTIAGGVPIEVATSSSDKEVSGQQLSGNPGDAVHAEFVYKSAAGVLSVTAAVADAVLTGDALPPPNPGPISIVVIAQA